MHYFWEEEEEEEHLDPVSTPSLSSSSWQDPEQLFGSAHRGLSIQINLLLYSDKSASPIGALFTTNVAAKVECL